jgi:hypothetical protein
MDDSFEKPEWLTAPRTAIFWLARIAGENSPSHKESVQGQIRLLADVECVWIPTKAEQHSGRKPKIIPGRR